MLKEDMTCEKCIYSEPFTVGEEVEFQSKMGVDTVVCKLHPATQVKGKKSWCGSGQWQVWRESQGVDDVPSQFSVYSWGDFEPSEEERNQGK